MQITSKLGFVPLHGFSKCSCTNVQPFIYSSPIFEFIQILLISNSNLIKIKKKTQKKHRLLWYSDNHWTGHWINQTLAVRSSSLVLWPGHADEGDQFFHLLDWNHSPKVNTWRFPVLLFLLKWIFQACWGLTL